MIFNENNSQDFIDKLQTELETQFPYVEVFEIRRPYVGNVYLKLSFEPREKWAYGYLENSNNLMFCIQADGKMRTMIYSVYEPNKTVSYETRIKIPFRKCKAKSFEDCVNRILKFTDEIKIALCASN